MGKKKRLNGLPGNLIHRYFSSMFYWKNGYMSDWIWFAAQEKSITSIEIDILNRSVLPQELEIEAIIGHLPDLCQTIYINLKSNNFDENFMTEAKLHIEIPENENSKFITGKAILKDINGEVYEGKQLTENVYSKPFKSYPKSINDKQIIVSRNKWWRFWN